MYSHNFSRLTRTSAHRNRLAHFYSWQRVKFTEKELAAAYENLSMLMRNRVISYPLYPELIAELDVFKSDFTFSGVPDYSLQIAQQSGIHALCLVTYDVDPEAPLTCEDVYYSYDPDLIEY